MKKRISTFLACLFMASFAQAQVLFDANKYDEGASVGPGEIVYMADSSKALQVVLDGWNSSMDIPATLTKNVKGVEAVFKTSANKDSVALYTKGVSYSVQLNDNLEADQVEASWEPGTMINNTCGASAMGDDLADFKVVRNDKMDAKMSETQAIQFYGSRQDNYKPTVGDTMWVKSVKFVYADGILFEPVNASIGELVTIGSENYRAIVLNGWNSSVDIADIKTAGYAGFTAKIAFQVSSTLDADHKLIIGVQANDLLEADQVEASWKPGTMVNNTCAAVIENVAGNLDPQEVKVSFNAKTFTEIGEMQFFAQQTWGNWGVADPGDTIYVSTVSMFASDNLATGTVVFDPADYVDVEGYEIVEVGGAKYAKFVTDGTWEQTFDLVKPYVNKEYNKVKTTMIVKPGTSKYTADQMNGSVQFCLNGGASAGFFTGVEVSDAGVEVVKDYDGSLLEYIQIFSQETVEWGTVEGAEVYIGKVEAYYEEPKLAVAPKTAKVQFVNNADFVADCKQGEAFWDELYDSELESEEGNLINRIAVDEKNKFELDDADNYAVKENANSFGHWIAGWDLNNFYLWVDIVDDNPLKLNTLYELDGSDIETLDGASAATWMNDCVELFLDFNNQRIEKSSRGAQQYQLRFNLGIQGPAYGTTNGVIMSSTVFGEGSNDTTNIQFATNTQAGGWILEVSVPWATLMRKSTNTNADVVAALAAGGQLFDGKKVAMEVSIADAEEKDGRNSILNWANNTGADKAYETAEFWGEIELTGSGRQAPTAINETAAALLNVYPNPANDVLYVGLEDVVAVNIYNVAGSLVKAANEAVVNIADLNAGIYVVKATDAAGNTSLAKFVKK